MDSIPVMLNLRNQVCLVIGGGKTGLRKAHALSDIGAHIIILDPAEINSSFQHIQEAYTLHHLEAINPFLTIAATNSHATNQQISTDCQATRRLVMQIDNPTNAHVVSMAYRKREGVLIAVHTGVPAFSRYLAAKISDKMSLKIMQTGLWLQSLRLFLKSHVPSIPERETFWREVFTSLESSTSPDDEWDYFCDILPSLVQDLFEANYKIGIEDLPPVPNLSEMEA